MRRRGENPIDREANLRVHALLRAIQNFPGDHRVIDNHEGDSSRAVIEDETARVQFIMHMARGRTLRNHSIERITKRRCDIARRRPCSKNARFARQLGRVCPNGQCCDKRDSKESKDPPRGTQQCTQVRRLH
jgi:hypothetical protein